MAYPIDGAARSQTVDLQADASDTLRFTLDEDDPDYASFAGRLQALVVKLAKGPLEIQVPMSSPASQGAPDSVWRGDLPLSSPDLVEGTYVVTVTAITDTGSSAVDSDARTLVAQAAETAAPTISVSGLKDGKVRLGQGDDLGVLIDDANPSSGIHRVTYNLTGIAGSIRLEFPYVIGFAAFRSGQQTLTVTATDRGMNTLTKSFTVIADAAAPNMTVALPQHLFAGIPADITVAASDASPYNVTFRHGNATSASAGTGPAKTHTFKLLADRAGLVSFTVAGFDILGNSVERSFTLEAKVPETDSTIRELATEPAFPVVGEAMSLKATVAQATGFVPLALNVTVTGAVATARNLTVQPATPGTLTIPVKLGVGRHTVNATVRAPAGVVELVPTNQSRELQFEVFFAKVTDANRTYYIRAGEFGVPSEALRSDGKTMPLFLVERGSAVVYEFTDGDRNVTWNPNPVASTQSPTQTDTAPKDSPGVAPVLLACALAALALGLRRRG